MKVAGYQAPLPLGGPERVIEEIARRVRECEARGIAVLCCPEAILGGLADSSDAPARDAIPAADLESLLAPLRSDSVTSIVGFSELGGDGRLYNSAAVLERGRVAGVYRKIHPAIRRSVYAAGSEAAVFRAAGITFGILICNDSNDPELARCLCAQGATVLFIPTNNGLPIGRASAKLNAAARAADIRLATGNRVWVVRADVVASDGRLMSFGSSRLWIRTAMWCAKAGAIATIYWWRTFRRAPAVTAAAPAYVALDTPYNRSRAGW